MELWIRTQNKDELLKVEDLCVEYNGSFDPELHPYRIIAKVDGEEIKLGIYEDEERAMEILDEIQKLLKPKMILTNNGGAYTTGDNTLHLVNPTYETIQQLETYVYEMPED